jgi:hypothetical protein
MPYLAHAVISELLILMCRKAGYSRDSHMAPRTTRRAAMKRAEWRKILP